MAAVIDALLVTLGLDTKEVDQGVDQATNKLEGLAATAAKALAVVGAVMAIKSMAMEYIAAADAAGKLSDALGMDIEDLQAWGEAAGRAGGSAEGFQNSVASLNQKMVEFAATGEGEVKKIFGVLGVAAKDAQGKVRPTLDVMLDLATKFEGMSKAESLGLGQKLGFDRGTIMLLQSGRKAVEDLVKRQKELGGYTKEDADLASRANDALADTGQAWRSFSAILMRLVVPCIIFVSEVITDLLVWLRENETFVLAFLGVFAAIIMAKVLPALIAWGAANIAALWPILLIIGAIALLSGLIALLIDDYLVWAETGESEIGALWEPIDQLVQAVKELWEAGSPLIDLFLDFGKVLAAVGFDLVIVYLQTLVDWIGTLIRIILKVKDLFVAVFSGDFVGALHILKDIFGEIFGFIERTAMRVIDGIKNGVKKIGSWFGLGGDDEQEVADAQRQAESIARGLNDVGTGIAKDRAKGQPQEQPEEKAAPPSPLGQPKEKPAPPTPQGQPEEKPAPPPPQGQPEEKPAPPPPPPAPPPPRLPPPSATAMAGQSIENQTISNDNRREAHMTVNNMTINAPGGNPADIGGAVKDGLNDYTSAVVNADSGVAQ